MYCFITPISAFWFSSCIALLFTIEYFHLIFNKLKLNDPIIIEI